MEREEQKPPAETHIEPGQGTAGHEPDEDAAELASLAVDDGKGNKVVPLSALIGVKKENRALAKKLKELEPVAARVQTVESKLEEVSPIIQAVVNDPKLRAAAMARTRPTAPHADQPSDDEEAQQWAEINDLWTQDADGKPILDVARARRQLDFTDRRQGRRTDEALRPWVGLTVQDRANQNLREALALRDDAGVPLATPESIQETWQMLPPHLLANPQVVEIAINNAIGLDRRKGRTPKAPDEPLYLATAGARGPRGAVVTAEEKTMLKKVGLTEEEYRKFNNLDSGGMTHRGVRLE